MRLLLFSDVHLDAPFSWMGATGRAAAKRRQALCETLNAILTLAREETVDAILCGGDLYEHERFSPDTVSFLKSAFEQVHPIPVYLAPGNHDWYGPQSIYQTNKWSSNVHVFTSSRFEPVELEDGVVLWGAAHRAPAGTANFLEGFTVDRAGINLALFHGSEMGALPFQERDKQPHAPFAVEDIERSGLSHAFLGHFHTPRDHDVYTYPGNPDPLTFGETGDRGAVIIDINQDGTIKRRRVRVARSEAHDLSLDISGCSSLHDIRDKLKARVEGLRGVARVAVSGELSPEVSFEPIKLHDVEHNLDGLVIVDGDIRPGYDLARIREEKTVRGEFVRMVTDSNLPPDDQELVLTIGLRALDGRDDLEVV